jgi:hypothetical protein
MDYKIYFRLLTQLLTTNYNNYIHLYLKYIVKYIEESLNVIICYYPL